MITIISPAKTQDFDSVIPTKIEQTPLLYPNEANELMEHLQHLSTEEIGKLMKISPALSRLNYERYQTFQHPEAPVRQAIFAYMGDVYDGLQAKEFSAKALRFAQNHLRIVSGLYGILRPLDGIRPYRLEMAIKLENDKGKTLYDFWKTKLTQQIDQELQEGNNVLVNLTSDEYWKAIDKKALNKNVRIIIPQFKEQRGNEYKMITLYAKQARGMMTRFIMEHQIDNPELIKDFNLAGYGYSEELSTEEKWVFVR